MTEEYIKERLSTHYIGLIAAHQGYLVEQPQSDFGVDCQLKKIYHYTLPNGNKRLTLDGKYLDIQLKATVERTVFYQDKLIKYDLDIKNYNDLFLRKILGIAPLILILFILPDDKNKWLEYGVNELIARKHAYWYLPEDTLVPSSNKRMVRISVPKQNVITKDSFHYLYHKLLS